MAETYSDFAEVYDELMDDTPYEKWCDTVVGLMEQYGISRPVRKKDVGWHVNSGTVTPGGEDMPRDAADLGGGDMPRDAADLGGEDMPRDAADLGGGDMPRDAADLGGEDMPSEAAVLGGGEMFGSEAERLASERNLVLDLGCGTGTLTELLYQRGYDMVGVDNAPAMLDIAMKKREASGSQILYLLQDMRELELYSTVGTVLSVCDSVNYILEEEELSQVFRLVNNYLYPGGIFLFDFNTDYKYREVIGDATIAENREDCSFIWENYYDAETHLNEYDVTVFVREAFLGRESGKEAFQNGDVLQDKDAIQGRDAMQDREGTDSRNEADDRYMEQSALFRRFTETHIQRGYTVPQMRKLVEGSGLEIVKMMDAETLSDAAEHSERVYVLARECQKDKHWEANV